MKNKDFKDLLTSIKQAGRIHASKMKPGRVSEFCSRSHPKNPPHKVELAHQPRGSGLPSDRQSHQPRGSALASYGQSH